MNQPAPKTVFLKDYREPSYSIKETHLEFDLYDDYADVSSKLWIEKTGDHKEPLRLHGQELQLLSVRVDGELLDDAQYVVDEEQLTIEVAKKAFVLETLCRIRPQDNTSLEGLYRSRTMFCTQCEAEGFRKITYYLDRPDVLSVFTTKITADKQRFPVLLANGNLLDSAEMGDRHWALWHDPFPKPAYLFALVAGDLAVVDDSFTTVSGKQVAIRIFVEEKDLDKCDHAVQSLKRAMRWDEQVYGREYDLDVFMIVAVDDFNMGAMENKGLNIFNTSCVLANPATTTDSGFQRVESVVAHEYFHNWSGNRVTCRDWFQLSLKEGFTVFRDAEFSADMGSRAVKRIGDVQFVRTMQFAEDAGPMAHPVRPESFIEISNFYTLTVYEKGAEVVRMIHTLLGPELFRKGSDLYFDRHDGQAVTVEDFVRSMADVSGRDFTQFMNWYRQAGTPVVDVRTRYDESQMRFEVHLSQSCPSTPEATAEQKKPFVIPLAAALLDRNAPMDVTVTSAESGAVQATQHLLTLTEPSQTFVFEKVTEAPVLSLLRGFSAPVKLNWQRDVADLVRILTCETDGFSRWDASQELAVRAINDMHFPTNHALVALIGAFRDLLTDDSLDPEMVSLLLDLPSESYLLEQQQVMDIDGTISARHAIHELIADQLQTELLATYRRTQRQLSGKGSDVSAESIGLRSLKNKALSYLMLVENDVYQSIAKEQFDGGENMTEVLSAFISIVHSRLLSVVPLKDTVIKDFYQTWQDESLVMNQWFSVQSSDPAPGALQRVMALLEHPKFDYKNPNKIRSVIGVFAGQNWLNFHAQDASGYEFLADQILRLNKQNPQIAARLITPLSKWKRLDKVRAHHMQRVLEEIKSSEGLSKDVYEVVSKSLE